VTVGAVGVICGLLDGGVVYALTGSVVLGVLVGVPTAAILVVLGVVGARQRQGSDGAAAAYEARRARQRRALADAQRRHAAHGPEVPGTAAGRPDDAR
jgi:hypothetical protein